MLYIDYDNFFTLVDNNPELCQNDRAVINNIVSECGYVDLDYYIPVLEIDILVTYLKTIKALEKDEHVLTLLDDIIDKLHKINPNVDE